MQAVSELKTATTSQGTLLQGVMGHVKDVHDTVKTIDGRVLQLLRDGGELGGRVSRVEGRLNGNSADKSVANLAGRFDENRASGARTAVWVIAIVGWVIALGGILWKVL